MNALQKTLHDPKKRRQLLIAAVALGGVVLFVLLRKKKGSSEPVTEAGASPAVEQVPVEASGSTEGGGGGGIGGGAAGAELGQTLQGLQQEIAAGQNNQAEQTAALISALSAGYTNGAGVPSGTESGPTGHEGPGHAGTPLAAANLLTNTQAGNPNKGLKYSVEAVPGGEWHKYPAQNGKPAHQVFVANHAASRSPSQRPAQVNHQAGSAREGQSFTAGKYKGKNAHIYSHAVKGGVGPKHNVIVL